MSAPGWGPSETQDAPPYITNEGEPLVERIFATVVSAVAPRIPRATCRLQLNRGFTFSQARALLDYLDALGVSDVYISPPFQARPDSMHGYDVVDHTRLSEDLGGREDFERLTDALWARGMGLLVDTVPNHMGIGGAGNQWWADVLENGPSSRFAGYFDIDWRPLKSELHNKVLLPMLGDHYGRVLDRGELKLRYERGAFFCGYWDWTLPLNPRTYRAVLEPMLPELFEALGDEHEAVLELQSILTGLHHLPTRTETKHSRVVERHREKEILKKRLHALTDGEPRVREALEQSIKRLNGTPGDPRSFDALDLLLEEQSYRLSFYRVAAEEINYRRFFDINDLAAVRMENPAVFAEAHRLLFELLAAGRVTGLRIDHPDGLWDPAAYLIELQKGYFLERCRREFLRLRGEAEGNDAQDGGDQSISREAFEEWSRLRPSLVRLWQQAAHTNGEETSIARPLYVIVEKILARGEKLPEDWLCNGTVGYEFGALLNGLFVDHGNEKALTAIYARATGLEPNFATLVYQKKKLVLQTSLSSELNVLAHELNRLSEHNRYSRDFTLGTLRQALVETIAWFPVYRTYVSERDGVRPRDRQLIERAIRTAQRRSPTIDPSVYAFLQSVLTLDLPAETTPPEDVPRAREFVMRFQQLTSPVMAKGMEDTAFYVHHRLVSLNEVGGEPERFGNSLSQFHAANFERLRTSPHALLATSTHDTKRGEDVRARIAVLSELPEPWEKAWNAFHAVNAGLKSDVDGEMAPDNNEEYLFYQTVIGTWPFAFAPEKAAGTELAEYTERVVAYMAKALKEAKVNTSWISPNPDYDGAVERFVRGALREGGPFLERLSPSAAIAAYHGMFGALSQVLLKLTVPGVPDLYQGSETWELRLVDPDNRRPVDWARRRHVLDEVRRRRGEGEPYLRELLENVDDGRIKLFVTTTALTMRRAQPALFAEGAYRSLAASGEREAHVIAFARSHEDEEVIVVAPRFSATLVAGEQRPPVGDAWVDTVLPLPPGARYENVLTGEIIDVEALPSDGENGNAEGGPTETMVPLSRLLAWFPLALLRRL